MPDMRLSFKEMCAKFDVTPRTLRYYEYIELLAPEKEGRARFYGPREVARMKLILRGRRFGFSLEEIRQWLLIYGKTGERDQLVLFQELADRQLAALQAQRAELDSTIADLMALRATSFRRAEPFGEEPYDIVVLDAEQRHIRRKRITLASGEDVLVDFENPVHLEQGDRLVLEDGRMAKIVAAPEHLMEVRARDAQHLVTLAWHIGNRHLSAQIDGTRILLRRDRIIRSMLEQLGATVITVPTVNADNSQHAPNENLRIGNLWDGIGVMAELMAGLGPLWPGGASPVMK